MSLPDPADLPFIVNGTDPSHRPGPALARLMDGAPDLEREMRWTLRLRESVRQQADRSPVDAGGQHLERLLQADRRSSTRPAQAAPDTRSSWLDTLRSWLTPPLALAAGVVAVQAVVIASLLSDPSVEAEHRLLRSGAPPSAAPAVNPSPHLRVMFRDGISEAALRALLRREGLEIVAGPNPVGEYRLAPLAGSADDLALVQQRLRADPAVATSSIEPGPVRSEH